MAHGSGVVPYPYGANAKVGPEVATTSYSHYHGFSIRETGGSHPITVTLHGTGKATGPVLEEIVVTAGKSDRQWYGPQGIRAQGGVYVAVSGTGTGQGAIFLS